LTVLTLAGALGPHPWNRMLLTAGMKWKPERNCSLRCTFSRTGHATLSPGDSHGKHDSAGKVKQGVGKAVGNDRLRAKGVAQEAKGEAQKAVGDAKGAIKKAADKLAGKAHEKL
jgi:uncharacterized protein YjbJ (UPF0337 family)